MNNLEQRWREVQPIGWHDGGLFWVSKEAYDEYERLKPFFKEENPSENTSSTK